jgi:membrane associated rhomboid family serine protease
MGRALVEIGWYPQLSVAHDRALVIHAMGVPCWVIERESGFGLYVDAKDAFDAGIEIARFESESEKVVPAPPVSKRIDPVPLFLFGWIAAGFMIAQRVGPEWWGERGMASSRAIMESGEMWRVLTALTLHADLPHFVANLATGLVFGAFLVPLVGGGLTWSGLVAAGAIGNGLNAWGYRAVEHRSIGASTGVFGLLGILVVCQLALRLRRGRVRVWEAILPVGAGLALLAYLGTGGGVDPQGNVTSHTDLMAHLWGFVAGIGLGVVMAGARVGERVGRKGQVAAGGVALGALVLAWVLAGKGVGVS